MGFFTRSVWTAAGPDPNCRFLFLTKLDIKQKTPSLIKNNENL